MSEPDFVQLGHFDQGNPLAVLLLARCCTTLTDDEAEKRMNFVNPTGISSPWRLCTEPHRLPVQCADDPGRRHLMFAC